MTILSSCLILTLVAAEALANPACAVCTIAVGASLEIARRMGVDDSVVGIWAGAFLALAGYWLILWFDKKKWRFPGRNILLMAISLSTIGLMYLTDMAYKPSAILVFYLDPFLFSTLLGAFAFVYSSKFYQWMKAKNGGHAHFPFEKVALPVLALLVLSVLFYHYPLCQKANDIFNL